MSSERFRVLSQKRLKKASICSLSSRARFPVGACGGMDLFEKKGVEHCGQESGILTCKIPAPSCHVTFRGLGLAKV